MRIENANYLYMSVDNVLFNIGFIPIVILIIFKNKIPERTRLVIFVIGLLFMFSTCLPRQIFGKWNAVKKIKDQSVTEIILEPSEPDSKVNLTDSVFIIRDRKIIDSVYGLLQRSDVYIAAHPMREWETYMTLITENSDKLQIKVWYTINNGTILFQEGNDLRNDALAEILMNVTGYKEPVFGNNAK